MSEKNKITASFIYEISIQIKQENTARLQDLIANLHVADIAEALATGPFITTLNDILGLFIYFMIGQTLL